MRRVRYRLTLGPDNEPLRVRLYVYPNGDHRAAMIVGGAARHLIPAR